MSPGLAARTAMVYALCAAIVAPVAGAQPLRPPSGPVLPGPSMPTAPTAPAPEMERRPVAVVDLAGDARSHELAQKIGDELVNHAELRPIVNQGLIGELVESFADEDAHDIDNAKLWLTRANEKLANHQLSEALSNAQAGQEQLRRVVPTAQVRALYAELSFVVGIARLGDKKPGEAEDAFALSFRLNPERKLDDDTTTPDVIAAYEAARTKAKTAKKVTLVVAGTGRTWIDGVDMGPAGSTFEVTAGQHVVWLTGPERMTGGKQFPLAESQRVEIADEAASERTKVRRARAALRSADDTTKAGAMQALAKLLEVGDAILITLANNKLVVQTWRDRAPGFSAYREYRGENPIALLEPLAPPRRRPFEPFPPPGGNKVVPIEKPHWYEKRNTWFAVGGTAAIVTGILLKALIHAKVPLDTNPTAR